MQKSHSQMLRRETSSQNISVFFLPKIIAWMFNFQFKIDQIDKFRKNHLQITHNSSAAGILYIFFIQTGSFNWLSLWTNKIPSWNMSLITASFKRIKYFRKIPHESITKQKPITASSCIFVELNNSNGGKKCLTWLNKIVHFNII